MRILASLLLLSAFVARGEIMEGYSIPSLVDASVAIGGYEVESVSTNANGTLRVVAWSGEIHPLDEEGPDRLTFDCEPASTVPGEITPGARVKDKFLIFFRKDVKGEIAPFYFINMTRPLNPERPRKGGYRFPALTADFRLLTTSKDIRDEVHSRLDLRPRKLPGDVSVEVPSQTGAWKVLYSGSTCDLRIPADLLPPGRQAVGSQWTAPQAGAAGR